MERHWARRMERRGRGRIRNGRMLGAPAPLCRPRIIADTQRFAATGANLANCRSTFASNASYRATIAHDARERDRIVALKERAIRTMFAPGIKFVKTRTSSLAFQPLQRRYSALAGSAICVCVTIATLRPSVSDNVVCHTEVVRPMCKGTHTAKMASPVPDAKKFVFDSSVPPR